MRYIDLFAGTGAFSHVLSNIKGTECVFSNDIEPNSEKIYKLNFPKHAFKLGDLNSIDVKDIPPHDLLCGGFPCQPFSIAGKQQGFNDARSNVFYKIIEILECHQPKVVVLENVKNLKTHDKGNTFKVVHEKLSSLGYTVNTAILDTNKLTRIPQHRERIYFVCLKNKTFDFNFNQVSSNQVSDFLQDDVNEKYYYTDRFKVYDTIKNTVVKENVVYQYRRHFIRENKSNCCPTLTANMGSGGHNVPIIKDTKGIRKLTPRECFNLQGFPVDYKLPDVCDGALYKLAGNAVSIPIIDLILKKIND